MFTILSQAFNRTARNWKMVLTVFIFNLSLGIILATPLYNLLQSEAQNSLEYDKLLTGFNFTVITDFLTQSRKSLRPFWLMGFALSGVYLLLNIFFAGGILSQFAQRDPFRLTSFLKNSVHYFGKFLLVFLIEMAILLVIALVSFALMGISLIASDGRNETVQLAWLTPTLLLSGFLLTITLNIGNYAKVILIKNMSLNAGEGVWKAVNYLFHNFKTMRIYWAILVVAAVLVLIYLFLESAIGMTSVFKIAIMFIIQQAFIFCRVFVKIWMLSGAFEYVSLKPVPLISGKKQNTDSVKDESDTGGGKLSD